MRGPPALAGLTNLERSFVFHYCQCGSGEQAKNLAGYKDNTSAQGLLRRSDIGAAVNFEIRRLMLTEGASIGFRGLKRIAQDVKAPAAAQVAAQKALLQGAGLLEAPQASGEAKSINDMDRNELREFIEKSKESIADMERQLAEAAQDVTPNPDNQVPDIFE